MTQGELLLKLLVATSNPGKLREYAELLNDLGFDENTIKWVLLSDVGITLDVDERLRLYRNFQVRFNRELPALPLYYPVYTYGVDAAVDGVTIGPLFDLSDRLTGANLWFLESETAAPAPAATSSPTP